MKTDILTSGSTVKNHISLKNGIRKQCNTENFVPIVVPGLSASSSSSFHSSTSMTPSRQERNHPTSSSSSSTSPTTTGLGDSETREREDLSGIDSHPVPVSSSHVERIERGDPLTKPTKNPKPNKNENHDFERRDPLCSDIPEWLQEFREILVDERVLEHRDSHASSSHEPSLQLTPTRSVDLGKHSVETHFPKDRNCEICQRTKIPRAPCSRRIGGAVPRAENVGDLRTADHKVLSERCESRKIIDMQSWCRIWPPNGSSRTKQKLLEKHKGACKSSWSRIGNLKSFTLTIPWNLAKPVKIFPGIIVRRHHTDEKQMRLLKQQCAE